ncbi:hypothetical protein M8494_10265 [Serratia ureilytica]
MSALRGFGSGGAPGSFHPGCRRAAPYPSRPSASRSGSLEAFLAQPPVLPHRPQRGADRRRPRSVSAPRR